MSINSKDLQEYIIIPVLREFKMWSSSAEKLIIGTSAIETNLGTYLHQITGPALGIYQCEPNTHIDLWNYINKKPFIKAKVEEVFGINKLPNRSKLIGNLFYATFICRLHYWRIPEALPAFNDIEGLAKYWKKYYNTKKGKGTVKGFIDNYHKYII
jgi:hypothetical protein